MPVTLSLNSLLPVDSFLPVEQSLSSVDASTAEASNVHAESVVGSLPQTLSSDAATFLQLPLSQLSHSITSVVSTFLGTLRKTSNARRRTLFRF